jgi:hypothetical protein
MWDSNPEINLAPTAPKTGQIIYGNLLKLG